jgi:hypothetical protein
MTQPGNLILEDNMSRFAIALLVGLSVSAAVRADDNGTETEIGGHKSLAPSTWKSQKPTTPDRVYQFDIPKADGDKDDAHLIVFMFRNGGGSVDANIKRWKTMVKPADGAKESDTYKVSEFKVGDIKVTMLEANGTYLLKKRPFDPDEQPEAMPNYRLVAGVLETNKGMYYIRMYGPQKTMEANRKGFDDWIKNLK